jgi:hypothetical protein
VKIKSNQIKTIKVGKPSSWICSTHVAIVRNGHGHDLNIKIHMCIHSENYKGKTIVIFIYFLIVIVHLSCENVK